MNSHFLLATGKSAGLGDLGASHQKSGCVSLGDHFQTSREGNKRGVLDQFYMGEGFLEELERKEEGRRRGEPR